MAIEGSLDLFQLPEILQVVAHQGKTGILTVQGEADIVAISFEKGRVVAADSLSQTLEDALGEVLAGQGLVSPDDFTTVAAEHQEGQGRLIDLLVDRGYVGHRELMVALQLHTYRLLIDLLGWNKGEFKFYSGDEVSYEEGFPPIDIDELLIRSVEEAAGQGHPTIPDSRSLYVPVSRLPGPIQVRQEGEEVPPGAEGGLWLTTTEKQLFDLLGEGKTVAELTRLSGGDEYRVRYTLHRLLELRVARRRPLVAEVPLAVGSVPAPSVLPRPTPAPAPVEMPVPRPVEMPDAIEGPAWGPILSPPSRGSSEREGERSEMVAVWLGRTLALLPVGLLFALLLTSPLHVPLPLPWQQPQRHLLEGAMRHASYGRIDRAAKTFYLLESSLPDQLHQLTEAGLLSPEDLQDPQRRPLAWRPGGMSYEIGTLLDGQPMPGTIATGTVIGNFLLDPDFLGEISHSTERPLVLLD